MLLAGFAYIALASASCSSSSGSEPFVCWLSGARCDCKPNTTVPTGGTRVDNCSTAQYAYCCQYDVRCGCDDNPGCGSGGRAVSACENDYQPPSTSCPGAGYVSCSDSSACPCGLICSPLTSGSSDRYCTQACSADSDCSSSTLWSFSSIGCDPSTGVCIP